MAGFGPLCHLAHVRPSFCALAVASFTNPASQVQSVDADFNISQGGGSFNFAATAPIPEPETYALILAGSLAERFMARRRRL